MRRNGRCPQAAAAAAAEWRLHGGLAGARLAAGTASSVPLPGWKHQDQGGATGWHTFFPATQTRCIGISRRGRVRVPLPLCHVSVVSPRLSCVGPTTRRSGRRRRGRCIAARLLPPAPTSMTTYTRRGAVAAIATLVHLPQPLYSARAKFNSGCGWPAYVLFLFMDVFFGSPDVLSRLRFLVSLSCVRGAPL